MEAGLPPSAAPAQGLSAAEEAGVYQCCTQLLCPSVLHSSERPGAKAGKARQEVASCLLASRWKAAAGEGTGDGQRLGKEGGTIGRWKGGSSHAFPPPQ